MNGHVQYTEIQHSRYSLDLIHQIRENQTERQTERYIPDWSPSSISAWNASTQTMTTSLSPSRQSIKNIQQLGDYASLASGDPDYP